MSPNPLNKSLENCRKAFAQLEEFAAASKGSRMDRAAVIQAFEFTYETFWHAFKKLVEQQGQTAAFPRMAIAGAFQMKLIADEALWLDMIADRNKTSHTYNDELSKKIYEAVVSRYLPAFKSALAVLMAG
jgi:nucleotidyltransferase substrate binding protein (TIGR01987 family)